MSGAEIYVSLATAKALEQCAGGSIRRKARSGELKWRISETRGANGKHEREYLLSSLSAEAQMKYATENSALGKTSGNALALGSLPLFEQAESPAARAAVPEHLQSQVDSRWRAIKPLQEFRSHRNGHRPTITLPGGRKVSNLNDLVAWLAAQEKVSIATLWSWDKRFREGGYSALADRIRSDAGKSKIFGQAPQRIDFNDPERIAREIARLKPAGGRIADLWINENYSARACHDFLKRKWKELGLVSLPSYPSVVSFLNSFPEMIRLKGRRSEKEFHDACAPYAIRDYTTARVNQCWVLDHGQDDFFVYNDFIPELDRWCFPDAEHNSRLRMWLTAFMDVRSRWLPGYAFSVIPSSTPICSALRMGVLRTGRAPQSCLLDRGEDMKKVGREKPRLPDEAQGALIRLIKSQWGNSGKVIFSIGEHPQSKPIESLFKTKRVMFDQFIPSYCGNKPANRPDRANEMERLHKKFLAREREDTPIPPASMAILATVTWIEQNYHREHQHSGHGMGGRTPEQVFRAGYSLADQEAATKALDPRTLDQFLWDRHERVVSGPGYVQMYGAQYEPADATSQGAMAVWNSRRVLVAADPHNIGDAIALNPQTGEFIAALICRKFLAWGASQETIRAEMRHQRSVRRGADHFCKFLAQTRPAGRDGNFDFLGPDWVARTGTDDGRAALPPAPGGGTRRAQREEAASPFNDDAAKKLISDWKEEGD